MSARARRTGPLALAGLLPAAALVAAFVALGVDAPLPDDVDAILGFANRADAAASVGERVALLFEPHVDHRIVTTRIAAASQLALHGALDLHRLAALGVAALLVLPLLIPALRASREQGDFAWCAAPAAWLLLQPQACDALLSPTMGANLLVLPFALGALLGLRRGTRGGFAVAAACAGIATFTQANGGLVLPAGLAALALAGRRRAAIAWLGVSALIGLTFIAGVTTSRAAPLSIALDLVGVTHYGLAFLGSALGMGSVAASTGAGAALVAFLAAWTWRGGLSRSPWLAGAMLFVLLSVGSNALARADLGADYAVAQPRYRAYSVLALALCHAIAFERWGRPGAGYRATALAAAVAFGIASWIHALPEARALATATARGLARWSVDGAFPAHPDAERAASVLEEARARGTFRLDPEALARHLDRVVERPLPAPSERVRGSVTRIRRGDAFALIEGRFDPGDLDPARLALYLVIDGERIVTARGHPLRRGGRGFRSLLPRDALPVAPRRVGLLVVDGANAVHRERLDLAPPGLADDG